MEESNNANNDVLDGNKKLIYIYNSQAIRSESFVETINDLKKDPEYEINVCDYVDEIIQMSAVSPCMMIFAAVNAKADVVEIVNLLTKLKTFIKMNFVKVLLFNYVKGGKVEQLFRKHGVGDFLDDAINAKSLGYKINLMMKAIETNYKKYRDQKKSEKEVKTFHSNSDPYSILSFIKPINQQFEIWSIENKKKLTFFNGSWDMEVIGPNSKLGEWKEAGGENELKVWQWTFFDQSLQDEFSPEGKWNFEGKKPEYYTASDNWKFSSKAPNFYFSSDLLTTFKIEFDTDSMQIAKDSRLLQTNLSQLKTLSSLLSDKSTSSDDIKALLSGDKKQSSSDMDDPLGLVGDISTEHLDDKLSGTSNGWTEEINENMSGKSKGIREELSTLQKGKGSGKAEQIDNMMKGDISFKEVEKDELWKTLREENNLGGYLRGDIEETDKHDGTITGEVDKVDSTLGKMEGKFGTSIDIKEGVLAGKKSELEIEKGLMEGMQDNSSIDSNEKLIGKVNGSFDSAMDTDELRNMVNEEFISNNMKADIGPGLQVRNKYDVRTEKKLKEKEEIEKQNKAKEEEEQKRLELRNKLDLENIDSNMEMKNVDNTPIESNMAGNGESADRLHSYWTDANHAFNDPEKQHNEWNNKASSSSIQNKNMTGSGESADEFDKYWRDPLHQKDSRGKEYHPLNRDKNIVGRKNQSFDKDKSTPDFQITEDDPLKKKKNFVKNSKGNWVTEDEFLEELANEEKNTQDRSRNETNDNVLEFKNKSLLADTKNVEMGLGIFRYNDDGEKKLVSSNKVEMIDIFDHYVICRDSSEFYTTDDQDYYIHLQLSYQEKVVNYELIGNLQDISQIKGAEKNLIFYILEGQEKQLEQIQEVYEKRQQAILSFFKQAKGY